MTQQEAVEKIMSDGQWRTLSQLAEEVRELTGRHASETSLSARLRDLRKPENGGHHVARQSIGYGLYQYQLVRAAVPNKPIPTFGKPVQPTQSVQAGPVAGHTGASRFLAELQSGNLEVGK